MIFHWPQLIMLLMMVLPWAKAVTHFGEQKKEDYYDAVDVAIGPAIMLGLLYWGGFFG